MVCCSWFTGGWRSAIGKSRQISAGDFEVKVFPNAERRRPAPRPVLL